MLGKSRIARATALVLGAFSGIAASAVEAADALRGFNVMPPPRRRGRAKNRRIRVYSRSKYMPHQGERECARRRGGDDWANFKARDRVRRGLPVSWPYQGMEG